MTPARMRAGRGAVIGALVIVLAIPTVGLAVGKQEPATKQATAPIAAPATPTVKVELKKAQPTAKPKPKPHNPPTIEDMIRAAFGPHADEALRVANCESRFNPRERSSAGAEGIFQIIPGYHAWRIARVGGSDLYDAATNVRVAFDLFKEQGWRPWVCAHRLGIR